MTAAHGTGGHRVVSGGSGSAAFSLYRSLVLAFLKFTPRVGLSFSNPQRTVSLVALPSPGRNVTSLGGGETASPASVGGEGIRGGLRLAQMWPWL